MSKYIAECADLLNHLNSSYLTAKNIREKPNVLQITHQHIVDFVGRYVRPEFANVLSGDIIAVLNSICNTERELRADPNGFKQQERLALMDFRLDNNSESEVYDFLVHMLNSIGYKVHTTYEGDNTYRMAFCWPNYEEGDTYIKKLSIEEFKTEVDKTIEELQALEP